LSTPRSTFLASCQKSSRVHRKIISFAGRIANIFNRQPANYITLKSAIRLFSCQLFFGAPEAVFFRGGFAALIEIRFLLPL